MWLERETVRNVGDHVLPLRPAPAFLVQMSSNSNQNTVTIPIGGCDPKEYLSELHQALCQAQMMIFERREIDLGEDEAFALYVLARLQGQIVR